MSRRLKSTQMNYQNHDQQTYPTRKGLVDEINSVAKESGVGEMKGVETLD